MITSLLRARLVDRLAVCMAPKILGRGIEAVGDLGIRDLADALVLADASVTRSWHRLGDRRPRYLSGTHERDR